MPTRDEVIGLMQDDEFGRLPALVAMGEAAVPVLVGLLGDPAAEQILRHRAAVALGEIGSAAAKPALSAALSASDPVLRILAARALARVAGPAATEGLAGLLTDPDASVVKVAAQCLAQVGDARALAALAPVAQAGGSDFVREQAQTAMDEIRGRIA